jgi:hypothetical protein
MPAPASKPPIAMSPAAMLSTKSWLLSIKPSKTASAAAIDSVSAAAGPGALAIQS